MACQRLPRRRLRLCDRAGLPLAFHLVALQRLNQQVYFCQEFVAAHAGILGEHQGRAVGNVWFASLTRPALDFAVCEQGKTAQFVVPTGKVEVGKQVIQPQLYTERSAHVALQHRIAFLPYPDKMYLCAE